VQLQLGQRALGLGLGRVVTQDPIQRSGQLVPNPMSNWTRTRKPQPQAMSKKQQLRFGLLEQRTMKQPLVMSKKLQLDFGQQG